MKKIAASARNRQNAKNIASYIEFMKGDKYMTKADLMKEFKELETEKGCTLMASIGTARKVKYRTP